MDDPRDIVDERRGRVREEAGRFIGAAFDSLREDNVVPPPRFHPYVRVGRDYFGPGIASGSFERILDEAFPERFANPLERKPGQAEFPSTYAFSLLEACVSRCASGSGQFTSEAPEVQESITELLDVLASPEFEAVACRFMTHMTTRHEATIDIAGVRVVPEPREPPPVQRRLTKDIAEEIPGAFAAFNREDPRLYDPPHALIVAAERAPSDPWGMCERASMRIERFLRSARLLTASTVASVYEVRGTRTRVSPMPPYLVEFSGGGPLNSTIRRTLWIDASMAGPITGVDAMVEAAVVSREGMAATSLDIALTRFQHSYRGSVWEQLVELATALEAILIADESVTRRSGTAFAVGPPPCFPLTTIHPRRSTRMSRPCTDCARSSSTVVRSRNRSSFAWSIESRPLLTQQCSGSRPDRPSIVSAI